MAKPIPCIICQWYGGANEAVYMATWGTRGIWYLCEEHARKHRPALGTLIVLNDYDRANIERGLNQQRSNE